MNSTQHRIIAAGVIGNVLEWYDFAIYGYFAAAIGRQFFPHEDPVAQLLSAFGVFALGYLMRPIGGALFGHIGDQFGRRAALTLSVAAMAIPTFLIGLLPGYATLGLWAPVALTLLRMTQGFSVGGEFTSSVVFLVERAPEGRRGLMGALAMSGQEAFCSVPPSVQHLPRLDVAGTNTAMFCGRGKVDARGEGQAGGSGTTLR
jgi:MFS transporter, MHS family, proline/betaine transporter